MDFDEALEIENPLGLRRGGDGPGQEGQDRDGRQGQEQGAAFHRCVPVHLLWAFKEFHLYPSPPMLTFTHKCIGCGVSIVLPLPRFWGERAGVGGRQLTKPPLTLTLSPRRGEGIILYYSQLLYHPLLGEWLAPVRGK